MAKLEATLDANITPFERALDAAKEKAKEFGEQTADAGKDLFKSLSGLDLNKLLGIGAATYAITKFGDALIDAAKEGLKAFQAYQDAVLRFKYTLPTAPGGGAAAAGRAEEAVETATAKAGIYSAEQMRNASLYLMEASKELRESPEKLGDMLDTLKAFAIKTSTTPEQIAESYRRLVVGIKEEGSPAVGKFFKATPGLEAETEKLRDAHAEAYLHAQGLRDSSEANTAQLSEYHRLQNQPISEFMTEESKREGSLKILEEIKGILERSAPKGIAAEAEAEHPERKLAAAWEEASTAFGSKLKPVVDDFVNMLISAMPAVQNGLVAVGNVLQFLDGAIKGVIGTFQDTGVVFKQIITVGGTIPTVFDALRIAGNALAQAWRMLVGHALEDAEAISKHVDEVLAQKEAEKQAREAPEKSAKAALEASTGIFSEKRIKSEEEVAKIAARTDAAHEASQRRIRFEQAQADLRSSAQAAARRAVIDRPRGDTEALDKQYAAQAKAAAAIINIKAAAQEKNNAAEEEAAQKIATIHEQANERNIERLTTEAKDDSEEKSATLARLNAEDQAAQIQINDIKAEAGEKEREADIDAANQIIDAQEAAANEIIDAQEAAAIEAVNKMKGPYKTEESPGLESVPAFGKWKTGPGGYAYYEESAFERKQREERNAVAEEANRQWKELQLMGIRHEFAEKKRIVEDALEAQRPTQISLKHVHEIQQEEHVKAIEAEKSRTEADADFARQHEKLKLPSPPPDKEAAGKADISRKVLAEILAKILNEQVKSDDFKSVFMGS